MYDMIRYQYQLSLQETYIVDISLCSIQSMLNRSSLLQLQRLCLCVRCLLLFALPRVCWSRQSAKQTKESLVRRRVHYLDVEKSSQSYSTMRVYTGIKIEQMSLTPSRLVIKIVFIRIYHLLVFSTTRLQYTAQNVRVFLGHRQGGGARRGTCPPQNFN